MTAQNSPTISAGAARAALAGSPQETARFLQAAAEAGVPEAQALLGQILLDGRGVPADPVGALGWFRKAAAAGHVMAINMVGRCYEKGWGTLADRVVAARWYRSAAEHGLDWGMYNYGSALGLGSGVDKDEVQALAWFQKAAALGHAKSINFVGDFYERGEIVPEDLAKAKEYYRRAAEGDDFRGQFNYARLLADEGRLELAATWLTRAYEAATPLFRRIILTYVDRAARYTVAARANSPRDSIAQSSSASSRAYTFHKRVLEPTTFEFGQAADFSGQSERVPTLQGATAWSPGLQDVHLRRIGRTDVQARVEPSRSDVIFLHLKDESRFIYS